jgi:hypothetical protein
MGKGATGKQDSRAARTEAPLAQPTDTTETFVREVDENLRRDRMAELGKKYGSWLIAGLILFLAVCAGLIWFQQHRHQNSESEVEQLAQIYKDIGVGNIAKVPQQLDALTNAGSKAVRASALFTRAALAVQQNDVKLAVSKYQAIANDNSLPEPYRDAALIRQTSLEFDQLDPKQVIARLQPLTKPGNPWFGSAGEMTALAMVKQGNTKQAGQLFATIAKDNGVPQNLRERALQIAGSLGADTSAALGTQAQ